MMCMRSAPMLYMLCTGKSPDPTVPATSIVEGLPTTFDIIIENCLAENPDDRFETVTEMKGALASLVAPSMVPPPQAEGLDVPIEFDVEIDVSAAVAAAPPKRLSLPPPSQAHRTATPAMPPPAAHAIGARTSMVEPIAVPTDVSRTSNVDLKGLLDEATANDAPRWMFVRGGLDHGPLSARELIQAIVRNEVTEDDVVFNMDSGERKKLTAWPQYREFAEQARDKRRKDQHTREVKSAIAEDSVSTAAKGAVAVALIAVLALIGLVYYKTLGPGRSFERRQHDLDDALAHGQLHLQEGGLQVLDTTPPPAAAHHGGGGHGGGGGFAGSYESAMNQPVDFNFAGGSGPGGGTLNDREISSPLNANLSRFGSCATAEMARGGSVRAVQMRIAVGGTGAPIGVTVVSGSGAFKNCVGGVDARCAGAHSVARASGLRGASHFSDTAGAHGSRAAMARIRRGVDRVRRGAGRPGRSRAGSESCRGCARSRGHRGAEDRGRSDRVGARVVSRECRRGRSRAGGWTSGIPAFDAVLHGNQANRVGHRLQLCQQRRRTGGPVAPNAGLR